MPRFFINSARGASVGDSITLTGDDAHHISRSLRMRCGEALCVCDFSGYEYGCEISGITDTEVYLRVLSVRFCESEPSIKVTIFQALPKGDKFDTVIQKCTEIGACAFTPVMTSRCISRPDEKGISKKIQRWQKIAEEASKQSGRGIIPEVNPLLSFGSAIEEMKTRNLALMCYECEDKYSIRQALSDKESLLCNGASIALLVGPEGGFSPEEAQLATEAGIISVGLGKRILRTETAPLFALSSIIVLTGNAE